MSIVQHIHLLEEVDLNELIFDEISNIFTLNITESKAIN
jgi:hypothetical protein